MGRTVAMAALILLSMATYAEPMPALPPPSQSACPASGDPPIDPGSTRTHPGHWHNPKRSGTGWDFYYFGNTTMMGFWYAYDTRGIPVWYRTSLLSVDSTTQTWAGDLIKTSLSSSSGAQEIIIGQISGRLYPGSATRMGIRWTLPGFAGPPEECIYDIYRDATISLQEANPGYIGNYADPQHLGWAYHYTMGRTSETKYNESEKLLLYDTNGDPVWLAALTSRATEPGDTTGGARGLDYYSPRSHFRMDTDCLDDPLTTNVNECVFNWSGYGSFSRTFSSTTTATISVNIDVPPGLNGGTIANPRVLWPNPAFTFPQSGTAQTYPVTVQKGTQNAHVYVGSSYCEAASSVSSCNVYVAWASDSDTDRVYRYNLGTGARDLLSNLPDGSMTDPLFPGTRVRYELRRGSLTGLLLSVSAEVLVSVGGGDSNSGAADVPSAPAAFEEPAADEVSDRVGILAANFRVDNGGNATYSVPLYAPRGRGGLTPDVSLSYSSAGGEGLLGTGFNLHAASSIQKCRSGKEFGDGETVSSTLDQFCLDGQRLLLWKGTHLQPNAEYRTEIESFQRIVLTLAPQIPASTFGTNQSISTYAFTVYGKDGSVRRFGGAAGTVVAPSTFNRATAINWLQTDITDVSGNTIQFTYSSQGSGSLSMPGERTLDRIAYTGGAIAFSYVASGRRDVSHSNVGDAYASHLLDRVTVYGAENQVLRRYVASYANLVVGGTQLVRPRVTSLAECADAAEQVCYPATTFTWNDSSPNADVFNSDATEGKRFPNIVSHRLADFDGDGRSDIVWVDQGGRLNVVYADANANGITFTTNSEIARLLRVDPIGAFQTFDIDADGQDDVLYLSESTTTPNRVAWYLRRANGRGFAAAELLIDNVGLVDAADVLKYESNLVDHTGDGLPDLVFRIGADGNKIAIMQRNAANADRPFSFASPLPVRLIDNDGTGLNRCASSTYTPRREQERSQAVDVDGDGRADLGFMSTDAACGSGVPIVTGTNTGEGVPPPAAAHEGLNVPEGTPVAYYFVTYRAEGVFSGTSGASEFRFTRSGRSVRVIEELSATSRQRARQRIVAGDLNADGYMDYVYLNDAGQWRSNLAVASLDYGLDQCVANCLDANHIDKVQLIDFDGDSKPDFWWPDSSTPNRNYKIYLWKGDGFATTAVSSGFIANAGNDWIRMPGDFDGDGVVDNLVVKPIDNGSADGGWSVRRSVRHHQVRGAITTIVNGFGARTEIDYSPLTFSSVYRRNYDGPLRNWGRGSAVFDLGLPNYVVHYVSSSAPIRGNPTNQAIVQYQYRGLKLQSGGRGSLGFARVSTIDLQTLVSVDTYLFNEFPFTSIAKQTNTRRLTAVPTDSCRTSNGFVVETTTCFSHTPICPGGKLVGCDAGFIEPAAGRIKILLDTYGWRYQPIDPVANSPARTLNYDTQSLGSVTPPAATAPIFVTRIQSNISDYDTVTYKSTRLEVVNFTPDGYDDFGNVLRSSTLSRRRSVPNPTDETTLTTEIRNTYADNAPIWKLGRLTSTSTFTRREEARTSGTTATTLGRRASFTYSDPLNAGDVRGLLHSERVEGMIGSSVDALSVDAQTRGTITYYRHDTAGNRTGTYTCSADISETICRSGAGGSNFQFHPSGRTVMRYSVSELDSLGRYVDRVSEPFSSGNDLAEEKGASTALTRNGGGDVLEAWDANYRVTRLRYGRFGRKFFAYDPSGVSTRSTWRICASNCPSGMALAFVETMTVSGAPTSWTYYDLLGRPTIMLHRGLSSADLIATVTEYDSRGNVKGVSEPFFAVDTRSGAATPRPGETIRWTTTEYDFLNRVYLVTAPDGGVTRKDYPPLSIVTTLPVNASGKQQTITENFSPQGDVISTVDAKSTTVTFSYDAGGQLLRADRGSGSSVSTYDTLGRKLSTSDADTGAWTFTVNDAGETITQTGARGHCTEQRIDGRARLWKRTDYAGACGGSVSATATWQFDTANFGLGKMASEQHVEAGAVGVARFHAYNSVGQLIETRTDQGGRTFYAQSSYDEFGRPFQFFFTAPGLPTTGERTEYNAQGYAYRVRSAYPAGNGAIYHEAQELDARGKVRRERMAIGAELVTLREFDPATGRLKQQQLQGAANSGAQDMRYDYDLLGNMKWRESRNGGVTLVETFSYDELQRLLGNSISWNGSVVGSAAQTYDGEGNVLTKGGSSYVYARSTAGRCATEPGAAIPGPHAVSRAGSIDYCYDAAGNVIRTANGGDERAFSYTTYDKLSWVRSDSRNTRTGFNYGAGREKIRRLDYPVAGATSTNTVTEYISGAEVRVVDNYVTEVVRHAGAVMIKQRRTGALYDVIRQYRIVEAQGSSDLVLDIWGNAVNASARMSFDPFGQRRDAATWTAPTPWSGTLRTQLEQTTRLGYTGHEQADEVGIVHMNGRIYDPRLGRFLQADPFVQAPRDSQSFNRYSYVFNNPMAYTDPSGYFGGRQQDNVRTGVAIVVSIFLPGYLVNVGLSSAEAAIVTGAVAGGIQSGNVRGAAVGALTAAAFVGIDQAFGVQAGEQWSGLSQSAYAGRALSYGVAGGVIGTMQGGRFGHGFASAGFGALLGPMDSDGGDNVAFKGLSAAMVGGTISAIGGGNFANGAITAALSFALGSLRPMALDDDAAVLGDVDVSKYYAQDEQLSTYDLVLLRKDTKAWNNASQSTNDPATIDVIGHGAPSGKGIYDRYGRTLNAEKLEAMIRTYTDFEENPRPIQLHVCWAGKGQESLAQQLADRMGVAVSGPTREGLIKPSGAYAAKSPGHQIIFQPRVVP
jgi:RHS repeat-associated protein